MRRLVLLCACLWMASCDSVVRDKSTKSDATKQVEIEQVNLEYSFINWEYGQGASRAFLDSSEVKVNGFFLDTSVVQLKSDKNIELLFKPHPDWAVKLNGSLLDGDATIIIDSLRSYRFSYAIKPNGDQQYVEFNHGRQQIGVLTISDFDSIKLPTLKIKTKSNQELIKKLVKVKVGSGTQVKSLLYNFSLTYDSLRSTDIVKGFSLSVDDELPYLFTDKGLFLEGVNQEFTNKNGVLKINGQDELVLTDSAYHKLINMKTIAPSFAYELRYATDSNFMKTTVYPCAECFLREKAAKAIYAAQKEFMKKGFRIKFFDCFRPLHVQRKMWAVFPHAGYVANPYKGLGSMHNRGVAVDLTLVDSLGNELDMGTPFDFFGKAAHHTCVDLPKEVLENRTYLKTTLAKYGFKAIRTEWWHYSYKGYKLPNPSDANLCE